MANKTQPFGRYELLDRISAGGMAEVFRAKDSKRGGQVVALKKILPQIAEDQEFIQMFEDEAKIASQLEHPHIARTLDFGRAATGGDYYIAFEYVDGKDLRAVFDRAVKQNEHPPLAFLLYVFARIGEGLSYAHARKDASGNPVSIVHRDVSPQNIVVSYGGDVKLIDFGIAKAAGKLSRTQVGAIKGKFGYMSPEQVRGMDIDQRTDVFSLGICMWELLTLERLFAAQNELLVLEKIRTLEIPAPSSRNPAVPAELDRIVLKALAKDVGERYRYAKELYRDLNVFAQNAKAVATREGVAEYMRLAFPGTSGEGMSYAVEGSPKAGGDTKWPQEEASEMRQVQETRTMADNKGSDLDIFEGLGKKSGGAPTPPPPRSSAVPPPPPRGGPGGPPVNELGKKTLMGIASPAAQPPPMPPSSGRPPAPPPGRGSLPPVVPPPQKSSAAPPPPPVQAKAPPPAASGGMDMDWDDEDEATHIFDKDADGPPMPPSTGPLPNRPAAGAPAFAPPPAPPPAMGRTMAMPPAQPTMRGLPPPTIDPNPPPPPPPNRPPVNPNAMTLPVGNAPMQTQTEPLRMPPRPPSAPPPPPPPGGQYGMMPQPPPPPPGGMQGIPGPHPNAMQQQQMQMGMGMGQTYPAQQPPQQQYQQPPQNFAPNRMEATAVVRPPSSSKAPLIIVLLLFVMAAAAAGAWFFVVPHTGKIAVDVSDSKGAAVSDLQVLVDGKKVCDHAPCIADKIAAGSHEVKVVADKFDPVTKLVTVESGKDAQVTFSLAGGNGTGIKVSGPQPGVKLLVDGNEVGALPQELHDMTPGDHKLKFVGSERYAPLEQSVTLAKDEVKDLGSITLKVVKGKATITLGTPGAKVSMVSSTGDRRDLPTFPISVEIEPAKSTWTLDATKTGYTELKQPISFDDGQAEKVFNINLDPKTAAPPPVYTGGGVVIPHPPPTVTTAPTNTGGGGETKFALITALPPGGSVCLLDNKPLGGVPKTDISTTPGSHKIRCLNKDEGLDKTIDVTVGAGDAKKVVVKLRD